MVVIDKKTDPEIINAFSKAFETIINEPSFIETSEKYIGIYPQVNWYKAIKFKEIATQIDPVAISWVKDWLNNSYSLDL